MTEQTTTDTRPTIAPVDIAPMAVKHLRSYADWLDRRRNDDLYTNSTGGIEMIEISPKEMEKLITGLRECADGLEFLASLLS
jgi:hypothetical protein